MRLSARLASLTREGLAFLVVGTLGFVAHAALLTALVRGVGILVGRGDDQHFAQLRQIDLRLDFCGLKQIPL